MMIRKEMSVMIFMERVPIMIMMVVRVVHIKKNDCNGLLKRRRGYLNL